MKIFYTYILVDTRKPGHFTYEGCSMSFLYEPFYVGKGHGDRFRDLCNRNLHVERLMKLLGPASGYSVILHNNVEPALLEDLSFLREVEFISFIGRCDKNSGPLLNVTDGGEGSSGAIFSVEYRKKLSEAQKRRAPASEETRKRISVSNSGKKRTWSVPGFGGHTHSTKTRSLMSDTRKGKPWSQKKIESAIRRGWRVANATN